MYHHLSYCFVNECYIYFQCVCNDPAIPRPALTDNKNAEFSE